MKFSKLMVNETLNRREKKELEKLKNASILDKISEIYKYHSGFEDCIDKWWDANYPEIDMDKIPEKDLRKLLEIIKKEAISLINSGFEADEFVIELLDIKITTKNAEAIYKKKLQSSYLYDVGWRDCYEFLKNYNLLSQ